MSRLLRNLTGVAAGMALDHLIADPQRRHPVALFGSWAGWVHDRSYADSRERGVLAEVVALAPVVGGVYAVRRVVAAPAESGWGRKAIGAGAEVAVLAATTWAALGGASLRREAMAVHELLVADDLSGARVRVRNLVGRQTDDLSADEVARAAIESVAENTSDAVVGTIFWGVVAGPVGVVAHRCANTLDAMWGHRSEHFVNFGWAAARLDDLLGWPGARLTVLATALAQPRQALAVLQAAVSPEAKQHPSPNAGPVEAGFAAALDVQLGGANNYGGVIENRGTLGSGRPAQVRDIPRTTTLAHRVGLCALAASAAAALIIRRR